MRRAKQVLASMIVLGAMASITVTSTYGLLNSEETNVHSSVASGTLTFSNTVNSGSACYSYGGASSPGNQNTCSPLFTSATQNYPGAPATATVTIANNGSLDASDLSVYMPSCAVASTPGAPAPGGASPCAAGGAQFYVEEETPSGPKCWFPAGAGACAFAANSLFVFQANEQTVASALDLGAGPAHGQTRTFTIGMQLPSNASNTLQGEEAVFSLTWHLTL
jgi:hypothetical protein